MNLVSRSIKPRISSRKRSRRRMAQRQRARTRRLTPTPRVEALEPRIMLAGDLALIDAGLSGTAATDLFPIIQKLLEGDDPFVPTVRGVFQTDGLPFIDQQLASHTAGKIADRIEAEWSDADGKTPAFDFAAATVQEVRQEITNRFGELVGNSTSNVVTSNVDGDAVIKYQVTLSETMNGQVFDLFLSLAPVVDVRLGHVGKLIADVSWTFILTFGVDDTNFFVDVSHAKNHLTGTDFDELTVQLTGQMASSFAGKGLVGIFGGTFVPSTNLPNAPFTYDYSINLAAPTAESMVTASLFSTFSANGRLEATNPKANLFSEFSAVPDFGDPTIIVDSLIDLDMNSDVSVSWTDFTIEDTSQPFAIIGQVQHQNLKVDFLKFMLEVINPAVGEIKRLVEPFEAVYDFFLKPVPGLNDISQLLQQTDGPSLINLLQFFFASQPNGSALVSRLLLIEQFMRVASAITKFPLFEPADFTADAKGVGGPNFELSDAIFAFTSDSADQFQPDPNASDAVNRENKRRFGRKFQKQTPPTGLTNKNLKQAFNEGLKGNVDKRKKSLFAGTGGLQFPVINDPNLVQDMLLGDPSPAFFTLGANFEIEWFFQVILLTLPIPLVSPKLGFDIGGEVFINLNFALDAGGIKTLNESLDFSSDEILKADLLNPDTALTLLNGIALDDHNGNLNFDGIPSSGGLVFESFDKANLDQPELAFKVFFRPFISLIDVDLSVVKIVARGEGELSGSLLFDWNDLPNGTVEFLTAPPGSDIDPPQAPFKYDGVLRGLEAKILTDYYPVFPLMNVGGSIDFSLGVFIEGTLFRFLTFGWRKTFLSFNILSFSITTLNDADVVNNIALSNPTIGTVDNAGDLRLFAGADAGLRKFTKGFVTEESDNATFETFTIAPAGPGTNRGEKVRVTFIGRDATGKLLGSASQVFDDVLSIRANLGSDDDNVSILAGVDADAVLNGQGGNDTLGYSGNGAATLDGGAGNDRLRGGPNNDVLRGRADHDVLEGLEGNDLLEGGAGNDEFDGGLGADTTKGGAGDDKILWDARSGADVITDDSVFADNDELTILGLLNANGSNVDDSITLSANAGIITVDTADDDLTVDETELISVLLAGGADTVTVQDLSGTDLDMLGIDLAGAHDIGPAVQLP